MVVATSSLAVKVNCRADPDHGAPLNFNMYYVVFVFYSKRANPFAGHVGASAVDKPESPMMERADRLGFFDPTAIERPGRVRTAPRKREDLAVAFEQGDPDPLYFNGASFPFRNLVDTANGQIIGQMMRASGTRERVEREKRKTSDLRRAAQPS